MTGSWRVVYPKRVLEQFRRIHQRAKKKGLGKRVLEAGKEIEKHLAESPRGFGDPWHRLREMELELFVRILPPLVIYYAVHDVKKIVFVKKFVALDIDD